VRFSRGCTASTRKLARSAAPSKLHALEQQSFKAARTEHEPLLQPIVLAAVPTVGGWGH
jgi:hypothetical protein